MKPLQSDSYQPILINFEEAQEIKKHLNSNTPLGHAIDLEKKACDDFMSKPISVPGSGEGGGYEHNQHKQNYIHMDIAGRLFLITQEEKYQKFILQLLEMYALVYNELPFAVSKDSNAPGRLFHQTLNENMWMLYASCAYSCIRHTLTEKTQSTIENQLFRPMIDLFIVHNAHDFDIIHNHGLWSVAGVGICGYAINDQEIVNKALFGLKNDSISGGFIAQLNKLFSPDGYYMEGPYYHRFALRPMFLFAEAIERRQPELNIYNEKNSVIKTTSYALISTAFQDGVFPALNDSSKTISINDEGVRIATSLCYLRYQADPNLLAMAMKQNKLWIHASSLGLSNDLNNASNNPNFTGRYHWGSLVLNDGANGDQGGIGILRHQKSKDENMAILWYGQHGSDYKLHSALDHGHFDGLHLNFFNRGQEVLHDYGFARWVNVEPKFGGRYVKENKSYAKQTIAHNTVTVDRKTQNNADTATAESRHGNHHFFVNQDNIEAISATIKDYYPEVNMQRTIILLTLDHFEEPLLIDLFRIESQQEHDYDYPIHYTGQLLRCDFEYSVNTEVQAVANSDGYQHIWQIAQANVTEKTHLISWLQGQSYYSLISSALSPSEIIFGRLGANDPEFNLKSEPMFIIRQRGKDHLFANILETHGYFNESIEASLNPRGRIKSIEVLGYDKNATIIKFIENDDREHTIAVSNQQIDNKETQNKVVFNDREYQWQGAVAYLE